MDIAHDGKFKRTDIWREGKWLDLWSVVHLLSGISMGLGLFFLHFGALASLVLALLSIVAYEMWEMIVRIIETPTNRFMDVVVGMMSFLPAFFIFAPSLSETMFILVFGFIFTANIVMSVFGWLASQKAAALERSMRARYVVERARLLERGVRLRKRFRHKKLHTGERLVKGGVDGD